jgi:cytochrome P450
MTGVAAEQHVTPRQLLRNPEQVFESIASCGDLVWVMCGKHRFLVLNHPELVRELLIDRATELVKHSQLIEAGGHPATLGAYGGGIPVPRFRAALARGLGPARIPDALASATSAAAAETERWRDGMSLRLMLTMRRVAAAAACQTSFGGSLTPRELVQAERAIAWTDLHARVSSRATRALEEMKLYGLRRRIATARLSAIGSSLIENADRGLVTQLTAVTEDLPSFHVSTTRTEQNAIVGELFQGAAAPLAQTAAWALLRFAGEQEAATFLRAEWEALPGGGAINRSVLGELPYTKAFIREVTRLHPTNARIVRVATAASSVGGEPVPLGCRVVVNILAIHGDPRLYDQPQRFRPERWLAEGSTSHKFAYLSFGRGSRRCLGENVAQFSLTALLPTLARNWDFAFDRVQLASGGRIQPSESTRLTVSAR